MSTVTASGTGARHTPHPVTPQTKLGWWALGLMGVAGLMMVLNGPLIMSGLIELKGVGIPIYLGALGGSALAAAVCSIVAMRVKHDRGVLLILPLVPAALITIFLLGEFGTALFGIGH